MSVVDLQPWLDRARELGADDATLIDPQKVVTAEWVRLKCEFGCDGFGECRTCPPHSPTPATTRRVLDEFRRVILMRVGPSTDQADSDRLHEGLRKTATGLERELFLAGFHKAWSIPCGPCEECDPCNLEGACLHPERSRPSMEACGIDVFSTVRNAGWEIEVVRDRTSPYRFFALVLVD